MMKKQFIITHDGKIAWNWNYPQDRLRLFDADKFIAEAIKNGHEILSDDRKQEGANVWD